jgi:ADP-ribose pyrophosphatase
MSEYKRLDRKTGYSGNFLNMFIDKVQLPNDHVVDLEFIDHPGAAAVVALDDDGCIIMVRQFRYAASGFILEIPAGKLDAAEEPSTCAARELQEETGYTSNALEPLGFIWTTPGFTNEKIWLYLATNLKKSTQALEDNEVLTVEKIPAAQVIEDAKSGRINDGKTVIALLRAEPLLKASGVI